jgi:hypothetical protein
VPTDTKPVVSERRATDRLIEFALPAWCGARSAAVAGDFCAWVPLPMERDPTGTFGLRLRLESHRTWRYRFLVDGQRWINDPGAVEYAAVRSGACVSVLRT